MKKSGFGENPELVFYKNMKKSYNTEKKEYTFESENMDTNSSVCNCGYSDIFDWRLFSNSNQT